MYRRTLYIIFFYDHLVNTFSFFALQATLREFYKAISLNKDAEQSWKKPIYKIIARMDDAVPEYFKSANWMEQLSDL